jgi:formamidopyrimidine-DNA glycosylase
LKIAAHLHELQYLFYRAMSLQPEPAIGIHARLHYNFCLVAFDLRSAPHDHITLNLQLSKRMIALDGMRISFHILAAKHAQRKLSLLDFPLFVRF